MGRSQRLKGHNYEREVANEFRTVYSHGSVRRGNQTHRADESDVLVNEGKFGPRLWIECKKGKQPNIRSALRQATEDSVKGIDRDDWMLIAVTKKDRDQSLVTLRLSDFLELLAAAEGKKP